ncbi:hypothetical protein BUALT_Bualt16G0050100 [Buddleja alternifolia]|uniref:Uncharacterized protein n=1 Tax=Buddleja alternifolia TaxID=168488 RepID=A0AAV6W9U7_9LAMI|nr:hypothetical protein BUALT_Bualt16G0050100 [Buddleja alternifolia]
MAVDASSGENVKVSRAKEEKESVMMQREKSPYHHRKETHGMSDDIDENTPINEIKGPNVFERAKEEIDALIQTIHPKKESNNDLYSSKKEGGLLISIGRWLEKLCCPQSNHKD